MILGHSDILCPRNQISENFFVRLAIATRVYSPSAPFSDMACKVSEVFGV